MDGDGVVERSVWNKGLSPSLSRFLSNCVFKRGMMLCPVLGTIYRLYDT